MGRKYKNQTKSEITPYSPLCRQIVKFLMDWNFFFESKDIDMYFTPTQISFPLEYSVGAVRHALLRLRDNNYITPHEHHQMYRITVNQLKKYLEDYENFNPVMSELGGRKHVKDSRSMKIIAKAISQNE